MTSYDLSIATTDQLGMLLQAARKAKGLSQTELAHQVGLSQSRVSHLELHPENIGFGQLMAWCGALGLDIRIGKRESAANVQETQVGW